MRPIRTGGSPTRAKMPEALRSTQFEDIAGWAEDDHAAALAAFKRSAEEIIVQGQGFQREAAFGGRREDWLPICEAAMAARDARAFFEDHFTPLRVSDSENPQGLFTGYYEPVAEGRLAPDKRFSVPIYRKPDDLVAFTPEELQAQAYPTVAGTAASLLRIPHARKLRMARLWGGGWKSATLKAG